jgi:hypothetical protein
MGKQTDLFGAYVEGRLRAWAREIRGGGENLNFPSINHIDVFHAHGKPIGISELAMQTEDVVTEIAKESPECATCLRTVYFTRGSWSGDRREILQKRLGRPMTRYRFWQLYHDAFNRARIFFDFIAKTS